MKRGVRRTGSFVALLAAVAAVLVLRAELMTVHEAPAAGTATDVVVVARTHKDRAALPQLTVGLVSTCSMTVNARAIATPLRQLGPATFSFRLVPALDRFDQRELRGCLQDLREDGLLLDVRELRTVRLG